MPESFILIPGRSSRQGVTLNEGKYTDGYKDETSLLRMHPDDMSRLGLSEGDDVRMWNTVGEVVVPCTDAGDECPEGLVFICYGDKSSQLMGGETHGSGMPDSKGLDVYLSPASQPRDSEVTATTQATPGPAADVTEAQTTSQETAATDAETTHSITADSSNTPHEEQPATSPVAIVMVVLMVLALLAFVFAVLPG